VIFPVVDIKKQASSWIFRKPKRLHSVLFIIRFGKLVCIFRYPDCQLPIWIIYLPKLAFFQIQSWIRAKTTMEFNNLFSLLSRFGKSVCITRYPDLQIPNLDNLLANTGFVPNPKLDMSKNKNEI